MGCLKRQVYLYMVPNLLNQHYMKAYFLIEVIIRCNFFFLFIGLEPTTWPANNCLQIMVCSCATSSTCVWLSVWLQIIFCSCVNERTLFSLLRSLLRENGSFPKIFIKKTYSVTEWWNNYWTRWMTLCMSRPLFVGSYLQVTWWSPMKRKKN